LGIFKSLSDLSTSRISMAFFGSQPTSAPQTFGGFGTNSSNPPTIGFGSPGTAQPAFGSSNPAQPTAPNFGSFATNTTTNRPGFGFGNSFQSSTATPKPVFGATTTSAASTQQPTFGMMTTGATTQQPSFGGFMNAGATSLQPQQQPELNFPLGAETPFKSLPTHIQSAIVDAYKNYKKPVHDALSLISRANDKNILDLNASIREVKIAALRLLQRYDSLSSGVTALHDQIKPLSKDFYGFCEVGVQELKKRSYSSIGNSSPDLRLLWPVLEQLEDKLSSCSSQIQQMHYHYNMMKGKGDSLSRSRGSYGQQVPVGAPQLFQLVQQQNDMLFNLASKLNDVHRDAEALKQRYLTVLEGSSKHGKTTTSANPFTEEEERMRNKKKTITQKLRADVQEMARLKAATTQPSATGAGGLSFAGLGSGGNLGFGTQPLAAAGASAATNPATQNPAAMLSRTSTVGGFAIPGGTLNALDLAKPSTDPTGLSSISQKKNRSRR
jgi:hypothetical protein